MRNVWVGKQPVGDWESLPTPLSLASIRDVDNLAVSYDLNTSMGGAANGIEFLLLLAQSGNWPKQSVFVHEDDQSLHDMMVDLVLRFSPSWVSVFESIDGGDAWVEVLG